MDDLAVEDRAERSGPSGVAAAAPATGGPRPTFAAVAAILVHLAIVVPLAMTLNLWEDEGYTLHTTSGTLAGAVRGALSFEYQPPLYFVLMTLWRTLGDGLLVLRGFSILCTVGTLALVPALSRRYLGAMPPWAPLFVFAVHPFLAWAALEVRTYALVILLSAALLVLFHDAFLENRGQAPRFRISTRRARLGFAALAIAALYTQYYLGFLLAALGASLVLLGRWRAVREAVPWMLGVALAFAPLLPVVAAQVGWHEQGAQPLGFGAALKALYWRINWYVLPTPLGGRFSVLAFRAALALGLVALAAGLWRRRAALRQAPLVTLACAAFGLATAFTVLMLRMPPDLVALRHTSALYVPALALVFALFAAAWGRRAGAPLAVVLAAFSAVTLADAYRPLAKTGDWARAAAYVAAHEAPGQPIVVYRSTALVPFRWHYRGANEVRGLTGEPDWSAWQVAKFALRDEAQVAAALDPLPERFWVVNDVATGYLGVTFHREHLDRHLADRYVVERRATFFGSEVRLVRRRAATSP